MATFLVVVGFLSMLLGVLMLAVNAVRKKRLRIWGVAAGGGLVLGIIGGALSPGPKPTPTPAPTPILAPATTITPTPTIAPKLTPSPTRVPGPRFVGRPDAQPKDIELLVGESAVLEGLKVTLTDAERTLSIGQFQRAEGGKEFVIMSLRLENVDTKTHSYNAFYFRIQTAGGQVLDPGFVLVEPSLDSGDLVAGGKVEGKVGFETPREEGHRYILYKPNPFKADRIVIQIQ
ncbi:MAG: DUF4352 domain-containing protein [Chloroflexota bacterium]